MPLSCSIFGQAAATGVTITPATCIASSVSAACISSSGSPLSFTRIIW
jgi:hypothetical protein